MLQWRVVAPAITTTPRPPHGYNNKPAKHAVTLPWLCSRLPYVYTCTTIKLNYCFVLHKCHIYTLDKAFLKDAKSALSIVTVNKRRHRAPNVILTRLMSKPLGSG